MFVNTTVEGAVKLLDCQEKLAVGAVGGVVFVESELLLHENKNKHDAMTDNKTFFVFICK